MWILYIFLHLMLHHFTLSQPITDDSGFEKLTNFEECCPCTSSKFDNNIGREVDAVFDDVSRGTGLMNDCPCRSRDTDAVGSPSILFPNAVRPVRPSVRQGDPKEDPKPLLHPEVDFASSVLETLREVTNEEYHEALARDAARNAAKSMELSSSFFNDAMPEESRNSVTIVVNPEHTAESEEHVLSEASHVQESRCIHSPLGSVRSNKLEHLTLPTSKLPSPLKDIFRLPTQPKIFSVKQKKKFDMDIGASNVQERLLDGDTESLEGLKLKSNPSLMSLIPENSFQVKKRKPDSSMAKTLLREKSKKSSSSNILKSFEDVLKSPKDNGLFGNPSIPKLQLDNLFQKSLEDEHNDPSISFKKPLFLKDLIKMKDVEIIPPKKVSDFLKNGDIFNIPNLKDKPILLTDEKDEKNIFKKIKPLKIGDLFRNPLKLEPIKGESNEVIDCKSDIQQSNRNPNVQKQSEDTFIETKILDTLPKASENNAVKTEILDTIPSTSEVRPVAAKPEKNIPRKTPAMTSSKAPLDYFESLEDSNENLENDMKVLHRETSNLDNVNDSTTKNIQANISFDKDQIGQNDHLINEHNKVHVGDKKEFCLVNRDIVEDSVPDTSNHILHTLPQKENDFSINNSAEDINTMENITEEGEEFKEIISTDNKQLENNNSNFQEDGELDFKSIPKEHDVDPSSFEFSETSTKFKEQDTEENGSIVDNVKGVNCYKFKEITSSSPDPLNEGTEEQTEVITESNLSERSIEITTINVPILNDDDTEVATESTNEISYEDLQKMSDSLLQLDDKKERMRNVSISKCKEDNNLKSRDLTELPTKSVEVEDVPDHQTNNSIMQSDSSDITNTALREVTTTSQEFISTETGTENTKEYVSDEDISVEDINSTNVFNKVNVENLCNDDIESVRSSLSETNTAMKNDGELNEMEVSASDPVAKAVRRPIANSAKNSMLGPPLRQNFIVQPSSLISGSDLFNRPVPDISDLLNLNTQLPSLNDITSRISSSTLHPNLNKAFGSNPQLPTFDDIKSRISSLLRASESTESALITNQSPFLKPIGGSTTKSKTMWPHNKETNTLGSLVNRKETKVNPYKSTADFRDATKSSKPHLLGDTINTPISALSDNFRSFTEDSLRDIQQTFKSTLKSGSNEFNLNDSLKNAENIFDTLSKTHSDVNDKLQSFHNDLSDRLSSIHESFFDHNKSPLFSTPFDIGSRSRLLGTPQSNIQRIKKPNLANRNLKQNFLREPSNTRVTLPKNIEQSNLKSFKQPALPKSTSDLQPLMIPRFKATTTKPFSLGPLNRPEISKQYGDGLEKSKPQRLIERRPISTFRKEPIRISQITSKPILRKPLTKVKVSFSTTERPSTTVLPKLKSSLSRTDIPSRNFKMVKPKLNSVYDSTGSPSELDYSRIPTAYLSRNLKSAENENDSLNRTGTKPKPPLLNKDVSKESPSGLSLSNIPITHLSSNTTGTKPKPPLLNKDDSKPNVPSSRKSSLPQTVAWPKPTENSFLSKVREAMKVRLSNLGQNTNGPTNKIKTGAAITPPAISELVDGDEEEDNDSIDLLRSSTHSPIKLRNTKSKAWSLVRSRSGPARSIPEVSDDLLESIENEQNSKELVTSKNAVWPKFTDARFKSVSNLSKPERIKSTSDQEIQAASVKSVRTQDQPLKENVSYRCKMVCTKE